MFNINIFIFKPITKYINTSFLQFWSFAGHSSSRWWPAVAVSTVPARARACCLAWLAWPKGGERPKELENGQRSISFKKSPKWGFPSMGHLQFCLVGEVGEVNLNHLEAWWSEFVNGFRMTSHPNEMENTQNSCLKPPTSCCWFHGKSQSQMDDDWGYPHDSGKVQIKPPGLSYTTLHNHWHCLSLVSPPI